MNLWAFNHHFIFWVTSSVFHLWPMCGYQRASRCDGGLCWLCESVCVEMGVCRWNVPVVLSAGRIPIVGQALDPRHSCSDMVYLCGERCWEEGEQALPSHILGGAVVSNKSKKQTKAWHWILRALYSVAAPANATQALDFIVPSQVKVTWPELDISTHLLCCTVAARLFGWWMCISLITSLCLLIKRLRYFKTWQKQREVLS